MNCPMRERFDENMKDGDTDHRVRDGVQKLDFQWACQWGEVDPPPAKMLTFLRQKVKNTQHFLKKKNLYCHPCLSTGSIETLCSLQGLRGGGQSLGDMSPKNSSFLLTHSLMLLVGRVHHNKLYPYIHTKKRKERKERPNDKVSSRGSQFLKKIHIKLNV